MADANIGQSIGWDDNVTITDQEFVILTPGTYDYTVKSFERAWFEGSEKMAPCNNAKVTITCVDKATGQPVDLTVNLYLNTKVVFRITQFFKSCGLVPVDARDGDSVNVGLFRQCIGRTGRAEIANRTYNGQQYNEVKKFLKPDQQAPTGYAAPQQVQQPVQQIGYMSAPVQSQAYGGGSF